MTLPTRLSLFFLAALACVLVGFSLALYALAHSYLHRQADERLQAALNTLSAAAEVGPDGVEWEPHERRLILAAGDGHTLRWLVTDEKGRRVDGSPGGSVEFFSPGQHPQTNTDPNDLVDVWYQGQSWRLTRQRLEPPPGRHRPETPKDQRDGGQKSYSALVIQAALSLEPVQATLRLLALILTALSLGLWLSAVVVGRWLCRRALRPLTRMAQAARTITAADLAQRLPSPGTGDELEDLGSAFNDLLARLAESFERQRRFTGDASHQLRTPLTAILGQVEVALRRSRGPEEYERVLKSVQKQAKQLREIVEMLLFLARADAEARLPHLDTIQLGDWLEERMRSWSTHPRYADFRVEVASGETFAVQVQTPLLGQLVDNLLDNACKYSEAGTLIQIRVWGEPGVVFLTVEDQGCGIDPGDLPHIFEPFYRSRQARQMGSSGVGLGLAVAKRIAEAFAGRISAASEPGKTTRFTLQLSQVTPCVEPTNEGGRQPCIT
jgi:heavy metal sensor kinase